MGPAIEVDELALQLNRVSILRPFSATFEAGLLHAIVGPNGAGKSSLLKCLLGLRPHQGQIDRLWSAQPGPVAYVPQQSQFEAALPVTCEEFLLTTCSRRPLFLPQRRGMREKIAQLLVEVGLNGKGHLRLGQLSGGERQRLLFAQGLQQQSQLWCLDEPMTGLDEAGQQLIEEKLMALRAQGATLLVVHHDMAWVQRHADRVWLIDGGLVASGTPAQVLGEPHRSLVAGVAC